MKMIIVMMMILMMIKRGHLSPLQAMRSFPGRGSASRIFFSYIALFTSKWISFPPSNISSIKLTILRDFSPTGSWRLFCSEGNIHYHVGHLVNIHVSRLIGHLVTIHVHINQQSSHLMMLKNIVHSHAKFNSMHCLLLSYHKCIFNVQCNYKYWNSPGCGKATDANAKRPRICWFSFLLWLCCSHCRNWGPSHLLCLKMVEQLISLCQSQSMTSRSLKFSIVFVVSEKSGTGIFFGGVCFGKT